MTARLTPPPPTGGQPDCQNQDSLCIASQGCGGTGATPAAPVSGRYCTHFAEPVAHFALSLIRREDRRTRIGNWRSSLKRSTHWTWGETLKKLLSNQKWRAMFSSQRFPCESIIIMTHIMNDMFHYPVLILKKGQEQFAWRVSELNCVRSAQLPAYTSILSVQISAASQSCLVISNGWLPLIL